MTFKWTTKEGKELKLNEICDSHLNNIYEMLKREKEEGRMHISGDMWGNEGDDIDAWLDDDWTEKNEKTLKIIRKEINKRKGGNLNAN